MTTETQQNLFTRDDTFFGVCEALGEDLHISSNLLRLAMAPLLIWNPVATVAGYLAVGVVIAAIRFTFPNRRRTRKVAAPAQAVAVAVVAEPAPAVEEVVLAKAA